MEHTDRFRLFFPYDCFGMSKLVSVFPECGFECAVFVESRLKICTITV